MGFEIPGKVREELLAEGWDGVSVIEPPGEQQTLDLSAPVPSPDADIDAAFGLPSPDKNRIGGFHAPASDAPETERLAAVSVYPRTGTARRKVLDFVASRGDRGATAEECATHLSMRHYTAAPRLTELKTDGWVESRGTRLTSTGTPAAVFVLTEAAKNDLGVAA